jgi:starch phosphorylase
MLDIHKTRAQALTCSCMRVQGLREYADDPAFQAKWQDVKALAKEKAVKHIREITGVDIPVNALLDIQVSFHS